MRSNFGAGLESGLIKPVARTVRWLTLDGAALGRGTQLLLGDDVVAAHQGRTIHDRPDMG
jgi:hypothetical protein